MCKPRLTILVGAGAVTEASNVSTGSITEQLLVSNKIHDRSKALFSRIYADLLNDFSKHFYFNPNFEDIFHGLEILSGLYISENAAPEFKPIYKIFTELKERYNQFNPYKKNDKIDITLSLAFSDLLKTIVESVESYSNKTVEPWYRDFFLKLHEHYNLDIFNLNYDTWFEKIFSNSFNDGFVNSNQLSQYLEFKPDVAFDLQNHEININHLHGQLDFTFINNLETAKNEFNDEEFFTIYKLKKTDTNITRYTEGNFNNTQSGEHLKNTTIITGKIKTEKIAIAPFDTYRANLQQALIKNRNLLIIGYGFADYYVNNVLQQFNTIHKENKRVNIIDFASEDDWNRSKSTKEQMSQTKFMTLYRIFKDKRVGEMLNNDYISPQIFNNTNGLYLRGFKNAAENNIEDIIKSYSN